jgi:lipopolysaccharide export system protein LptA
VAIFAIVLVVSVRKGRQAGPASVSVPTKLDPEGVSQGGEGHVDTRTKGKGGISLKFGNQVTYADGRVKLGGGVTLIMPDKDGRSVTVESKEAEVTRPPGKDIGTAVFTGGVKLTTSDGVTITSPLATYNDDEQIVRIPGEVAFTKGRMTGTGVGATYDQARSVLWILDRAKVDVTPDKAGSGEIHVTAKTAGMARNEHYMKFLGDARLDGQGNVVSGDDVTAFLTEDDERLTRMELRGNARITGKPGTSGPQDMRANDIDLAYAEDGRTLQSARLIENASVQLPGQAGKGGRRIAGKAIDIGLAPDGSTVTNLVANENVQVDLPADGDLPARRIRSASLLATGPSTGSGQAPAGIQAATFSGDVEYRETRAARAKLAAVERTAKSARMDLKTKPGFGDIEQASFHTNVRFTDGTKTTADAPTAVYVIGQDRLDLSPGEGDTGRGPHVSDGRISVEAVRISMMLGTQVMKADTNVRSLMVAQSKTTATKDGAVKVPSLLKQDQPVNVKSNRLNYDGANSVAIYDGNARLWQEEGNTIRADKITLEDKSGNLRGEGNVNTLMLFTRASDKTAKPGKPAAPVEPTQTTAENLLYEDGARRATYTGKAHMSGPDGDVTAEKIELFLAEQGGQLERAEADGNVVSRQEVRRAYGQHLTYLAKDESYTMTGSPVKVYDDTPPDCKVTEGAVATFQRTGSASSVRGSEAFPHKSGAAVCGAGPGSF